MPDERGVFSVPYMQRIDGHGAPALPTLSDADVERIAVAVVRRMMIAEANISIAKTDALIAEADRKWR